MRRIQLGMPALMTDPDTVLILLYLHRFPICNHHIARLKVPQSLLSTSPVFRGPMESLTMILIMADLSRTSSLLCTRRCDGISCDHVCAISRISAAHRGPSS
jgi:hypothetical protein